MFMMMFFIFLALYFILRGGREAGFWGSNPQIEGICMAGAGLFLLFDQLVQIF